MWLIQEDLGEERRYADQVSFRQYDRTAASNFFARLSGTVSRCLSSVPTLFRCGVVAAYRHQKHHAFHHFTISPSTPNLIFFTIQVGPVGLCAVAYAILNNCLPNLNAIHPRESPPNIPQAHQPCGTNQAFRDFKQACPSQLLRTLSIFLHL